MMAEFDKRAQLQRTLPIHFRSQYSVQPSYRSAKASEAASEMGMREVESLFEKEIECERQAKQLLATSLSREIKRVGSLLDQTNKRIGTMEDQSVTLAKERERLLEQTSRLRDDKILFEKVPEVRQRLEKMDQVQNMQRQVSEHLALEEEKMQADVKRVQMQKQQQYQQKKRYLQETRRKKEENSKEQQKLAHRQRYDGFKPTVLRYDTREVKQQLFGRDLDSLQGKVQRLTASRGEKLRSVIGSKEQFMGEIRLQLQRLNQLRLSILCEQLNTAEWESKVKDQEESIKHMEKVVAKKDHYIAERESQLLEVQTLMKEVDDLLTEEAFQYRRQKVPSSHFSRDIMDLEARVRELRGENFKLKAGYDRVGEVVSSKIQVGILRDLMDVQKANLE